MGLSGCAYLVKEMGLIVLKTAKSYFTARPWHACLILQPLILLLSVV